MGGSGGEITSALMGRSWQRVRRVEGEELEEVICILKGILPSSRLLPRFLRMRQITRAMLRMTIIVPTMATTMMISLGKSPRPPSTWFNSSSRSPRRG